jgi:poly-gamma-glutamate synthesis protein (capsule biosynthesis protein)
MERRTALEWLAVLVVAGCMVTALPTPLAGAAPSPRITILFTGDDLATHATWGVARTNAGGHGFDFRPMFARLRPLVSSADLALCHLETPLAGPTVQLSDYPRYAVPGTLADAIAWAGYDGCSTASNHSLDHGLEGIRSTLRRLDRVGLGHTGTARSAEEARRLRTYRVGGATIAHLSFTWSFNGLRPTHAWESNRLDPWVVVRRARRARRLGADLVVVSLHWGVEHRHAATAEQRSIARRILRTHSVDLLVGHHAHVVQPIARSSWRFVAYGLGNSLSGMTSSLFSAGVQDGIAVLATFERGPRRWHLERLRYAPTWVDPSRFVVRLVGPALDAGRLPDPVLRQLRRSWRRTVEIVDARRFGVTPFRGSRLG